MAGVLGPLTAGVILGAFDQHVAIPMAYGADALLFTVAMWATLRLPPIPPAEGAGSPGLRSLVEGFRYLAGAPVLLLSFAVDIVAMVVAMPRALFPEVSEDRFGGGSAVGWLFAAKDNRFQLVAGGVLFQKAADKLTFGEAL